MADDALALKLNTESGFLGSSLLPPVTILDSCTHASAGLLVG